MEPPSPGPIISDLEQDVRVLHVDDDPALAEMVAEFLERASDRLTVRTVSTAAEALDVLESEPIDCVVSDYEMPSSNGLELHATVQDRGMDVPFVLFTGRGSEEIASEAISAGVTDYFQKQSGTDQYAVLANRIEKAVDNYRNAQRLERRSDLLARTQEIAAVGGWELNVERDELLWTAEVYRIHGLPLSYEPTVEDAVGRYHSDDVSEIRRAVNRAVETGESFDLELRLVTDDDEVRWVRARGEPAQQCENGNVERLRGTVQDISERRADRQELELKDRVLDEAAIGVSIADPNQEDYPLIYVNDEFLRQTGYDEADVLGQNCRFLQGPETSEERIEELRAAINAERPIDLDICNYRADGTTFWNHVTISPVYDDADELTHMVGFQEDVTERKRLERELYENEVALRDLHAVGTEGDSTFQERLERTLTIGCERLDLRYGFLTRIEDGTQTILELRGSYPPLSVGTSAPLEESFCRKTFNSEGLVGVEHATSEGWDDDPAYERFGLQCYLGGTIRVGGETFGTLCFADTAARDEPFTDTEEVFVELLTQWVTHELEQRRNQERLEQKNARLDRFASVVSHDLRNPLNVAMGHAELARESDDDADEHLERVESALERIETLVTDLLALSRQGETVEEPSTVSLEVVADRARSMVDAPGASFRIEDDATISADENRLQQLLENLFRNAAEHAGENPTVTVTPIPDGFAVEDDGPGIPDGERSSVFDAGYTTVSEGTGLGLSIVEEVCAAHGWEVTVADAETGGARFEIGNVEQR